MYRVRQALLRIAAQYPSVRPKVLPLTRRTAAWETLPKGWTRDSLEKFWESLTGKSEHEFTDCIEKMDGKFDDPGAFCASLADKVIGPEWRKKKTGSIETTSGSGRCS